MNRDRSRTFIEGLESRTFFSTAMVNPGAAGSADAGHEAQVRAAEEAGTTLPLAPLPQRRIAGHPPERGASLLDSDMADALRALDRTLDAISAALAVEGERPFAQEK